MKKLFCVENRNMHKMLTRCPNCGGDLAATRLSCTSCETVILAQYTPCRFCRLSSESLHFIEAFVRNRGNLKEMEREVGESYWSLRSRLNDVIDELGFEVDMAEEMAGARRREVLERLGQGEIDAEEAARLLAQIRREGDR
jgi:hypothetical protein